MIVRIVSMSSGMWLIIRARPAVSATKVSFVQRSRKSVKLRQSASIVDGCGARFSGFAE